MRNTKLILIISLLLAGCASTVREINKSGKACCANLNEASYVALNGDAAQEVLLSAEGPQFDFPEGRSPLVGFKVPEHAKGSHIWIYAYSSLGFIEKSTALVPMVTYLDESKLIISKSSGTMDQMIPGDLFKTARWIWKFDLPEGARYFVVHVPAGKIGEKMQGLTYRNQYLGTTNKFDVETSNVGRLAVYVSKNR